MEEQKGREKAIDTDLGIITVRSYRNRDTVRLAHTREVVFILNCPKGKKSQLTINKKFYQYEQKQWEEVFKTYVQWKRRTTKHFKLPHYSGRRTDGGHHPWRWKRPTKTKTPQSISPRTIPGADEFEIPPAQFSQSEPDDPPK